MQRMCLECSKPFKGRSDKKFCSDNCRVTYNNDKNATVRAFFSQINKILYKNRKILKDLIEIYQEEDTNPKVLQQLGFNFGYHTHIGKSEDRQLVFYCYEYGYIKVNKNKITLYKSDQEIRSTNNQHQVLAEVN